jgi:hypothetical protein
MPSKKKPPNSEPTYGGDRVKVNMHRGRIVDATIKAVIERTDGKRLLGLTSASGQPPKTPGMKSCGVCVLGYRAFRGSDRFTATGCVPKARASSLAQRDYR